MRALLVVTSDPLHLLEDAIGPRVISSGSVQVDKLVTQLLSTWSQLRYTNTVDESRRYRSEKRPLVFAF
jgi:hypothetical protein